MDCMKAVAVSFQNSKGLLTISNGAVWSNRA